MDLLVVAYMLAPSDRPVSVQEVVGLAPAKVIHARIDQTTLGASIPQMETRILRMLPDLPTLTRVCAAKHHHHPAPARARVSNRLDLAISHEVLERSGVALLRDRKTLLILFEVVGDLASDVPLDPNAIAHDAAAVGR